MLAGYKLNNTFKNHIETKIAPNTFSSLLFITQAVHAQVTTIAVVANLKDAFSEILLAFKSSSTPAMRVVYGSSGNLSAQIMNGAPFNLFIAADEHFHLSYI